MELSRCERRLAVDPRAGYRRAVPDLEPGDGIPDEPLVPEECFGLTERAIQRASVLGGRDGSGTGLWVEAAGDPGDASADEFPPPALRSAVPAKRDEVALAQSSGRASREQAAGKQGHIQWSEGTCINPSSEKVLQAHVRYFVIANEPERRDRWATELADHGFEVTEEYHSDGIIITLGGDGSILHAARNYEDPTILPVLAGRSEGNRSRLDSSELLAALDSLEGGDRTLTRTTYDRISAYRDGEQLRGGYQALNEISLHHRSPVLGAVFAVRIRDGDEIQEFERVIGDGVLVATPFGATGYYRSITGGTFADGLGVAFNNIHKPQGMPVYRVCSMDAVVELELLKTSRSSGAVLTRDNDDEMYELSANAPIEIRRSEETVDIVDIE